MNPMLCPTWGPTSGPLPAAAQSPEGAPYSGLLECPMTTRITKLVSGSYVLQGGATAGCTDPILTFQECTSLSGSISTILTLLSWICAVALPSPVCA